MDLLKHKYVCLLVIFFFFMLSKMKSKAVSELWLKLYSEGSYQTLTELSVNYYKNNIYVLITTIIVVHIRRDGCHPASEVFVSFFVDDKTSAPDIFRSCSFVPDVHFETSLVIVSYYGYDRSTSVVRVQAKTWQTFLTNSQRYIYMGHYSLMSYTTLVFYFRREKGGGRQFVCYLYRAGN